MKTEMANTLIQSLNQTLSFQNQHGYQVRWPRECAGVHYAGWWGGGHVSAYEPFSRQQLLIFQLEPFANKTRPILEYSVPSPLFLVPAPSGSYLTLRHPRHLFIVPLISRRCAFSPPEILYNALQALAGETAES